MAAPGKLVAWDLGRFEMREVRMERTRQHALAKHFIADKGIFAFGG
jgi:hypothetical protein